MNDPKHYGTDQNDDQSIMRGGESDAGVDGQNGEGARRVNTTVSPGDDMP